MTFVSSNPNVASVDADGKVTALALGQTAITITAKSGVSTTINVTVVSTPAASITLNKTSVTLKATETEQLTASILPETTTDKSVVWTSSDESVATVDADGTVTAISASTARITAACGEVSGSATVTVKSRPETPKEYVRKGNGTSCTFIVMMDLPNERLAEEGYRFVYGYTDTEGVDRIIAETNLRYCHTTSAVYNDPENDFWVYAYTVDSEGEIVCSLRRHLDGTADDEVAGDLLSDYLSQGTRSGNPENWITVTSEGARICLSCTDKSVVTVHSLTGALIRKQTYERGVEVNEELSGDILVPDTYIITVQSGKTIVSKKIIIR